MPEEKESGNDKSGPKGNRTNTGDGNPQTQKEHPDNSDQNTNGWKRLIPGWKLLESAQKWQVIIAGIGVVLALIGIMFLNKQNEIMDRQNTIMETQNKLMERQTDEARELAMRSIEESATQAKTAMEESAAQNRASLDASIKASELDQRAWIGVLKIERINEPSTDSDWVIDLHISNTGKTPAIDVAPHALVSLTKPTRQTMDRAHDIPVSHTAIAPNATFVAFMRSQPLPDQISRMRAGAPAYFFGTIHYVDIFNKKHETTFCAVYISTQPPSNSTAMEFCEGERLTDMN